MGAGWRYNCTVQVVLNVQCSTEYYSKNAVGISINGYNEIYLQYDKDGANDGFACLYEQTLWG